MSPALTFLLSFLGLSTMLCLTDPESRHAIFDWLGDELAAAKAWRHNPGPGPRYERAERIWREQNLMDDPCESCLDHGWHWCSFSGDLHYMRESCLVPGNDLDGTLPREIYEEMRS